MTQMHLNGAYCEPMNEQHNQENCYKLSLYISQQPVKLTFLLLKFIIEIMGFKTKLLSDVT